MPRDQDEQKPCKPPMEDVGRRDQKIYLDASGLQNIDTIDAETTTASDTSQYGQRRHHEHQQIHHHMRRADQPDLNGRTSVVRAIAPIEDPPARAQKGQTPQREA